MNNPYLHGFLDEELYLLPPEGYNGVENDKVCKCKRSLYGLKQAGLQSHNELSNSLMSYGFNRSTHDNYLFLKGAVDTDSFLDVIIYVDDILACGTSSSEMQGFKDYLHTLYTIKDMGLAKFFLGVEITQSENGIFLSQTKYVIDMIKDAGLKDANIVPSPTQAGNELTATSSPMTEPNSFRKVVGRLLYLGFTRPYISIVTQQLSQFMQNPQTHHMQAAMYVLKYLKGTLRHGIFYPAKTPTHL